MKKIALLMLAFCALSHLPAHEFRFYPGRNSGVHLSGGFARETRHTVYGAGISLNHIRGGYDSLIIRPCFRYRSTGCCRPYRRYRPHYDRNLHSDPMQIIVPTGSGWGAPAHRYGGPRFYCE